MNNKIFEKVLKESTEGLSTRDIREWESKLEQHLKYLSATGDGKGTFKYREASKLLNILKDQKFI
jgi:hypothetical protein